MATTTQIQALYVGYFGRPGDPAGLKTWTTYGGGSADKEASLDTMEEIAAVMATSAEYKADTAGKTVQQVIAYFYQNLFNRVPEIAGLNYWTEEVNSGRVALQDVGLMIGRAALASKPAEGKTNSDYDAITSKTAAADLYTADIGKTSEAILAYQGGDAANTAASWIQPVVSTATIPTAASVSANVTSLVNGSASVGDKLSLTIFKDVATSTSDYLALGGAGNGTVIETSKFRFNSQNQVIDGIVSGAAATLGNDDVLTDADTSDADVLNVTGSGTVASTTATVANIEAVNFTAASAVGEVQFDNMSGAKTFTATGTVGATALTFDMDGTDAIGITSFDSTGLAAAGKVAAGTVIALDGTKNYTVTTSALKDNITTGSGSDTITSGAGNDIIDAGGGVAVINAGAGTNTVTGVANTGKAATITQDVAGSTAVTLTSNGQVTITNTAGTVTTVGSATVNNIDASTSTSSVGLSGAGNADNLTGGSGNDSFTGGTGADNLDLSGGGTDRLIYAAAADTSTGAFAGGNLATTSTAGMDIITGAAKGDIIDVTGKTLTVDAGNASSLAKTNIAGLGAGTDAEAAIVRGFYNATAKTFQVSAVGESSILQFSSGTAGNGDDIGSILLLNFNGGGAIGTGTTAGDVVLA